MVTYDAYAETINKLLNLCDVQGIYAAIISYVSHKFCVCYAGYVADAQGVGMVVEKEAARLETMRQVRLKKEAAEKATEKVKVAALIAEVEAQAEQDAADEKAKNGARDAENLRRSWEGAERVVREQSAPPPITDTPAVAARCRHEAADRRVAERAEKTRKYEAAQLEKAAGPNKKQQTKGKPHHT